MPQGIITGPVNPATNYVFPFPGKNELFSHQYYGLQVLDYRDRGVRLKAVSNANGQVYNAVMFAGLFVRPRPPIGYRCFHCKQLEPYHYEEECQAVRMFDPNTCG